MIQDTPDPYGWAAPLSRDPRQSGQQAFQRSSAGSMEAAKAMGAGNRQMSEAARRQAVMAELNKPRPAGMGMAPEQPAAIGMAPLRMQKMYKGGGKVSKSGRSYRGYGKARIPS